MQKDKPVVLIGSPSKEMKGPIPTITKEFIHGLSDKYKFIPFYAERKYGKTKGGFFNFLNIYYFFKHFFQLIINLIVYKPDIAHYAITSFWNLEKSLMFLQAAGLFGAKKIGHLHGGSFDKFWLTLPKRRKKIAIKCMNSLDSLIVLGRYWESFLKEEVKSDISIVYNPIDYNFENKTKSNNTKNRRNILFVGSIGKRKGVYDIVECVNRLKEEIDCRISLVGHEERSNDMMRITNLIEKYKLKKYISLEGSLYGKDKIKIFNESAIFLFPSYNENFPLVIIEAAASGLAIITTPVGALPEFFKHNKSVIFVEPGNIKQITNAIVELINDDQKRRRLGNASREVFIKRLNRKKIFESLDSAYQAVLRDT